jgi:hypothetical protein
MLSFGRREGKMTKTVMVRHRGSAVAGMLWMLVISLLLFWLPFFGPLIAGFVGGKKSGGVGPAITAVFLPAVLLGVVFFILGTATGLPLIGVVTGTTVFLVVAAAAVGPLLLGAIIGGAVA